jgi:hypothetical protein
MPSKQPWPEPIGGGFMAESEIRRRWTGDADEKVLMHYFKRHDPALGTLHAAETSIRHYRTKWKGQDWRRKMYQAAASKYGGIDPRVAWLQHCEKQQQQQQQLQQLLLLQPQPGRTSHSLKARDRSHLAAADAIDAFVAREEAKGTAHDVRIKQLQAAYSEANNVRLKVAVERHAVAAKALQAATEMEQSNPPGTMSRAELRFIQEDFDQAVLVLKQAQTVAADASNSLAAAQELVAPPIPVDG